MDVRVWYLGVQLVAFFYCKYGNDLHKLEYHPYTQLWLRTKLQPQVHPQVYIYIPLWITLDDLFMHKQIRVLKILDMPANT